MASIGFDPSDNTTSLRPPSISGVDYLRDATGGSLQGLKIGLLEGVFNRTASNETTPVNSAIDDMVTVLKNAGVEVIQINETVYNSGALSASLDVQAPEFRENIQPISR